MRALIQRTTGAQVQVAGEVVGSIGLGFVVLLGITTTDTPELAKKLAQKVAKLRIFEDENEKLNLALHQVNGECLVISQFTLYGDTKSGNRPSFTNAARPEQAEPIYETFVAELQQAGIPVATGVFGAMMDVQLVNSGPTTIWIDTADW